MTRARPRGMRLTLLLLGLTAWAPAQAAAQGRGVVEQIRPTSGPPDTVVQVIGRRLGDHGKVSLGDVQLTVVRTLQNRITVKVPAGAQTGRVVIETPSGPVLGPEFRVTARLPAPEIEGLEPAAGPPGSEVEIRGKHFSTRLTGNLVTLGERPVVVRSATPVALRVIVPLGAKSAPFKVRVGSAGEAVSAAFEVTTPTAVTSIEPARAAPGTTITIHGSGFSGDVARDRVYLNNTRLELIEASQAKLVVKLPSKAASGKLLVDVSGGGRAESKAAFVVQRPPSVVTFTPSKGRPGTVVTVRGTNFGSEPAAVEARLGDAQLTVREAERTRLVLEVPAGAPTERISIRVHGVGPAWSDKAFRVMRALEITSFAPRQGPAGTVVTIAGKGFDEHRARNSVTVGGQHALVLEASETELKVRVPPGKSGPIRVRVGGADARTTDPFVVTVPPEVQAVEPKQGTVGTELRIRGRGFGNSPGAVRVTLAGKPMAIRSVRDDLLIARVVPGAESGALEVAVPLQGVTPAGEFQVLPR